MNTHWTRIALLFLCSCKWFVEDRPDYRPVPNCKLRAWYTDRCLGLILTDGVINCAQCYSTPEPQKQSGIYGCYSYDYNVYCVNSENLCGDNNCRQSPVDNFGGARRDFSVDGGHDGGAK